MGSRLHTGSPGRLYGLAALALVAALAPSPVDAQVVDELRLDPEVDRETTAVPLEDAPSVETCGRPGLPPCPLQRYMRANVAAPLAANDPGALALGLSHVARLTPDPAWTEWSVHATSGAKAASAGDIAEARKACAACHGQYRAEYRRRFRDRPVSAPDDKKP